MSGWGHLVHLAGRFVRAHRRGELPAGDRAFVATVLTAPELGLWERMAGHDHRHTVEVARRVETALAGTEHAGEGRWLAAALLHDVGKVTSGLGIYGRVLATLAATAGPARVAGWAGGSGLRRRMADYRSHDRIGGEMIRAAGGREEAAHWARCHHHRVPCDPALIPGAVAEVLAAADPD